MIKIENLSFSYGKSPGPALRDVSLEIGDGEFVVLAGPSGGGKSSLCRALNGLIPHFYGGTITGRVTVDGVETIKSSTRELAERVGFVFQDPENQLVSLDVEREVAFGLENLALPRDLIAKRLEEALDALGIAGLRRRQLNELSGGEKQKVAIASVLALHPAVLILDEPTSELDPKGAEDVLSVITRLNDELGLTIILVEHRLDRVLQYADRLIVMEAGQIAVDGPVREVMTRDYQKLADTGIGIPPVIRLFQELRTPEDTGDVPLTVKEGRAQLGKLIRKDRKPPPPSHEESTKTMPVIKVEHLSHSYPTGQTALRNVSLTIGGGEFVAVMGRNASGKTTLVKHLNRLLEPTEGTVRVMGRDTRQATTAELAREVGFVFQNPNDHLFADTVAEEIAFTLKQLGYDAPEIARRTDEVLTQFRLTEYRGHYPRNLSGGEKQRVALASVLAAQPRILVLDEPTRGLEYHLKSELMQFLSEYRRQGNTVILVTHDVEIAAEYAARVVILSEGKVVVDGEKHDVLAQALLFSPQINRLLRAFEGDGIPGGILTVGEARDILS